jgi:hypothetical protein
MCDTYINKAYLHFHPDEIFVFGDNTLRRGHGGAARLRDEPNTYGFITKRYYTYDDDAYYTPTQYQKVYTYEIALLIAEIKTNPDKTYLISKLGAGLANRHHIFEEIIEPSIKTDLAPYNNVKFLW